MSTRSWTSRPSEGQGWHPPGWRDAGAGQDASLQDPGCCPCCASLTGDGEEEEEEEEAKQSHAQKKLKAFGLQVKLFFLTM